MSISMKDILVNDLEHYEVLLTWQPVNIEVFLTTTMGIARSNFDVHLIPNSSFTMVPRNLVPQHHYRLIFKNKNDAERFSLVADPVRI